MNRSVIPKQMKAAAYEFASLVDREIEALSTREYLRRAGRAKRLVEELYPLSRLGLHLKHPGLTVEVEAFEDSGGPDGLISIRGFQERTIEVQVTCADYGYEEALRSELLVEKGACPGAGEIRRDKVAGAVVAVMGAVHSREYVQRIATAVIERLRAKALKQCDRSTALLIAFHEVKLYGWRDWEEVLSSTRDELDNSSIQFSEVYLFNGARNELRGVA